MKKHLKVILCFVITAIIIIGAILFFRHNYVNLEGEFVKRDIEKVNVHLEDVDINELNRCSEIRDMIVSRSADDSFAHLKVFSNFFFMKKTFSFTFLQWLVRSSISICLSAIFTSFMSCVEMAFENRHNSGLSG